VASGRYSDGSLRVVTDPKLVWSAVGAAATVDANGIVTGVARGSAMIKASLAGILGSSQVKVTGADLQALQIDPPSATISAGEQLPLQVVGTFSDGSLQELTSQLTWSSSAENVAIVSYQGIVHALSSGSTTISARYSDMVVSMQLSVASSAQ
jgi:uncharacterized protein YjdB